MQEFDRISVNPEIMGGRPCIRGMRFPISRILSMLAARENEEDILANHPDLEPEDIRQAMSYAARIADEEVVLQQR
ncbi:MAG TPA: DUF433 domain-containing protein [Phycisphaerae bacterium]|nr:DUF433 domain-containing protein [Phycisphaerae bacterium]